MIMKCTKCGNSVSDKVGNFMEVFYHIPHSPIIQFVFCYDCYWDLADLLQEHNWHRPLGETANE